MEGKKPEVNSTSEKSLGSLPELFGKLPQPSGSLPAAFRQPAAAFRQPASDFMPDNAPFFVVVYMPDNVLGGLGIKTDALSPMWEHQNKTRRGQREPGVHHSLPSSSSKPPPSRLLSGA